MNPCSQAAKQAAEGAEKMTDEAESKEDVVKQEKVKIIAHSHKTQTLHMAQSILCSHHVALR